MQGWFSKVHLKAALEEVAGVDAIALGPGVGQRQGTKTFVEGILKSAQIPLVIDADGLNLIAGEPELLAKRKAPTILTPHPGEAARLLGVTNAEIQANRIEACDEIASKYGVVVALKGAQTVVTAPSGQRYINPTGNSGLAKGGSGDVLTGLIAGLLAQGCEALAATQLGVFLHGVAADEAARKRGVRAMTPSDVIDHLGDAFMYLEKQQ